MNVIDIISNMYKNELAEANHKKIIALAQCNVYEQRIKQLEKQLKEIQIKEIQKTGLLSSAQIQYKNATTVPYKK